MSSRAVSAFIILAIGSFLIASCGKSGDSEPERSREPLYKATGNEGSINGRVFFNGIPPAARTIDMSADKYCADSPGSKVSDQVVVNNGGLANVFVYVKSGGPIGRYSFPVPQTPVVLDQKYCRYDPHVLGIMVGQTLKVINSDQTGHNVHPSPSKNKEWNESQPAGGPPIEKSFSRSEVIIPVKCNQHPWMSAYIGVLHHPFFSVSSAADGSFNITGLPPGDYVIAAWHEKYGEQTQKVTIGPKQTRTLDFTYSSSGEAYAPSSLKVDEALVLP